VSTDEYFKELNLQWEAGKLNSRVYQKRGSLLLQEHNPRQSYLFSYSDTHSWAPWYTYGGPFRD